MENREYLRVESNKSFCDRQSLNHDYHTGFLNNRTKIKFGKLFIDLDGNIFGKVTVNKKSDYITGTDQYDFLSKVTDVFILGGK